MLMNTTGVYSDRDLAEARRRAAMPIEERIAEEWGATERLPFSEQGHARNILCIKYEGDLRLLARNRVIDASPNVIRFADAKAKLPKDGA